MDNNRQLYSPYYFPLYLLILFAILEAISSIVKSVVFIANISDSSTKKKSKNPATADLEISNPKQKAKNKIDKFLEMNKGQIWTNTENNVFNKFHFFDSKLALRKCLEQPLKKITVHLSY